MKYFILECMILGVVSAFITILYNYTLQYNAIFSRFGRLLEEWSEKGGFLGWISNPLGNCIYCSGTWIAIIITIIYWCAWIGVIRIEHIIPIAATIGTQHIVLRLWCDYIMDS